MRFRNIISIYFFPLKLKHLLFLIIVIILINLSYCTGEDKFKLGNEVLLEDKLFLVENKNIGIITNNSGVTSNGTHLIDILISNPKLKIEKIFTPEHGFKGDDINSLYYNGDREIHIISLYENKKSLSKEDLKNIDVLIYDIQDIGVRFFTYISTLYYCIESCYKYDRKIIICDRPVIGNPNYVDGFLLEENCKSFVGLLDIPVCYGMTCGELALMINDLYFNNKCDLELCEMQNYSRNTDYDSLNLTWVKPSPNIYYPSSAVVYPSTCFLEGTNISEGRGSEKPFEYIGAPFCNSREIKNELDKYNLKGVMFEEIAFTPSVIISKNSNVKYLNQECYGVYIKVTDKKLFEPVKAGIALLITLKKLYPEFKWRKDSYIDKLAGTRDLRKFIDSNYSMQVISDSYKNNLEKFINFRSKFLFY